MPRNTPLRTPMPTLIRVFFLLICLLLIPHRVFADGKVFSHATPVVTIPDQSALIHYQDGVQYLAIETRFEGEGQDFAWVVPLPSAPEIEEVTTGLFPTLRTVFSPQVIQDSNPYWGLIAYLFLLTILGWTGHRYGGAAGYSCVVIALLITTVILLPTLNKSRGIGLSSSTISILDRKLIGSYETLTIQSDSPTALTTYLNENGFVQSKTTQPIIAEYVRQGWVFVATRLRRDNLNGINTPHPLGFRFPTDKPVYPLKLTAADNGPLSVELFVFGDQRAAAEHFTIKRCELAQYPEPDTEDLYPYYNEPHPIVHAELKRIVGNAKVITHLKGTLSPKQMSRDAYLSWEPYQPFESVYYSMNVAWTTGLNITVPIMLLVLTLAYRHKNSRQIAWARLGWATSGLCSIVITIWFISIVFLPFTIWFFAMAFRPDPAQQIDRKSMRLVVSGLMICILATVLIYATHPKIKIDNEASASILGMEVNTFIYLAKSYFKNGKNPIDSPSDLQLHAATFSDPKAYRSVKTLRSFIHRFIQAEQSRYRHTTFQSKPEEDSPFHFILNEIDGGVEFIWYDQYGGAHPVSFTEDSIQAFYVGSE